MNKIDFTCTFQDRNIDRVLFDRIHESIMHCEAKPSAWTYYPTAVECNKVIKCCVQRLKELAVSHFDLDDKLEKEQLTRSVLDIFANIQFELLSGHYDN